MARSFNGSSDRIVAANSPSLESASTAFTLAVLFRDVITPLDDWGCLAEAGGVNIQQSSSSVRQYVASARISTVFTVTAATTVLTADTWYLAACRWASGGTLDLTIFNLDGSVNQTVSSTAASGTLDDTGMLFRMGNDIGGGDWSTATIARCVYDAVRWTDLECQHLIRGLLPPRPIAGAYYELFGTVSPEPDWSGNGNHGTVTGTTRTDHPPMLSADWYGPPVRRFWSVPIALQKAYATTDTLRDNWEEDDASTTDIFDQIDETTADDADYIRTVLSPTDDVYVTKLTSLTDPSASTSHTLQYRYGKSSAGGEQINLIVQLRQGYVDESTMGTLIAEWTHTDIGSGWTLASQSLTGTQADSISNYGDLYIRIVGDSV
jgi:hypothetical protein